MQSTRRPQPLIYYFQNQTTKSAVSANYDYETVRNTAEVLRQQVHKFPGTLLNRYTVLLTCNLLSTASNTQLHVYEKRVAKV